MSKKEPGNFANLMEKVAEINRKHNELVRQCAEMARQNMVFSAELAEQSKRISDLYEKIFNKTNRE